jgi:glutathione S-transferase
MRDLVCLTYSPWSERALWALDHHGLAYRLQPYTPMLGEVPLRLRLRQFSGRVTVPVLFTNHGPVRDSADIALHADQIGSGTPLWRVERDQDIRAWVARSEVAMQAGRNLVTRRTGESRAALVEALPPPLRALGPLGDAVARSGVNFFMRKYDLFARSPDEDVQVIAAVLTELREALGGRQTIFPEFSFADIAMSGVLQIVTPVKGRFLQLGPATRDVWATPELEARYPDLVAWRDRLYAEHRERKS